MKTNYSLFLSFLMSVLYISDDLCSQNALIIEHNCETNCIDLSINGGYAPYEVEWQKLVEGQGYVTIAGWPKFDLEGNNGVEDLCISESGDYQVVVLDMLCGAVSV